eukprot:gene16922-20108_t
MPEFCRFYLLGTVVTLLFTVKGVTLGHAVTAAAEGPHGTGSTRISKYTNFLEPECLTQVVTMKTTDADDVEEAVSTGRIYSDSSDLEFGYDDFVSDCQVIGLRFASVMVPPDARILTAELVVVADTSGPTAPFDLQLRIASTPDCPAFTGAAYQVTSLEMLPGAVTWRSPAWSAGGVYRSADVGGLLEQLVRADHGWVAGGAVCLIVETVDACASLKANDLHYEAESANTPQ